MRLRFTKMQGLGNDFVVIDAISQTVPLDAAGARRISDRHFGVGCDQVLLIERPRSPRTDFYYRIFNADGEEVEAEGELDRLNGVRRAQPAHLHAGDANAGRDRRRRPWCGGRTKAASRSRPT